MAIPLRTTMCDPGPRAGRMVSRPGPADPPPKPLKSGIVSFDDAKAQQADWGEMRRYFTGETSGTKNVLTAVAIVKPGKAVHRAHRHAEEEYLILAGGSGIWSLDGKETPAKRGRHPLRRAVGVPRADQHWRRPVDLRGSSVQRQGGQVPRHGPDNRPDEQ